MEKVMKEKLSINGYGSSSGGAFRKVTLNGNGKIQGDLECIDFQCNGNGKVHGDIQTEKLKVSGNAKINGHLTCTEEAIVDGRAVLQKDVITKQMTVSGSTNIGGKLKSERLTINGKISIDGNCDVEAFKVDGAFVIGGLLNADEVRIRLFGESRAKEIGGHSIKVEQKTHGFMKLLKSFFPISLKADLIEGDTIELEATEAKVVRGKDVVIGKDCHVDLVEYSGTFKKDSNASVKVNKKI